MQCHTEIYLQAIYSYYFKTFSFLLYFYVLEQNPSFTMAFNDKEKSAVDEALKEAECYLANTNNDIANAEQYPLAVVVGVVKNNQERAISVHKSYDFTGKFLTSPPPNGGGVFVHQGATLGQLQVIVGSKAAILYGTIDKLPNPLGWVLAWDKPDNDNPTKVYVEAGNLYKLENMEWSEIESKLDASTNKSQYFDDKESFAAAIAEIKDQAGKLALLGACFDQYMTTSHGDTC